jgi:hypothetical protein
MCVITAYGVQCLVCWLSELRCRAAGYASGMRDFARRAKSSLRICKDARTNTHEEKLVLIETVFSVRYELKQKNRLTC